MSQNIWDICHFFSQKTIREVDCNGVTSTQTGTHMGCWCTLCDQSSSSATFYDRVQIPGWATPLLILLSVTVPYKPADGESVIWISATQGRCGLLAATWLSTDCSRRLRRESACVRSIPLCSLSSSPVLSSFSFPPFHSPSPLYLAFVVDEKIKRLSI